MKRFLANYLEDILLIAGCLCVLYGLSLLNAAVTWIVAGLMLAGFGVLVGKAKANATD